MEQQEFTNYIIPKLLERFPQFTTCVTNKPDGIIDIDYKSRLGKLTFWVTTQDREITIGFDREEECDWHTHMSLFGANTPDEELQAATKLIDAILNDEEPIVHSNLYGYTLTTDVNTINDDLDDGEVVEVVKWSEL